MIDPTQRFSSRVENYVKYRPGYPIEVITTLREECQLTSASVIADIGSGTGILTELFLTNGNPVYAIEPNAEMRAAGERLLAEYPRLHSLAGRAEATTLADQSVDFIVAGQAFHWFDHERTRHEFTRILKPGGWVLLVWNERETQATPFLAAYEELLQRFSVDYAQVDHRQVDPVALGAFYGPKGFKTRSFNHQQVFDFAGIRGRLLSSSYAPEPGHLNYEPMLAELEKIFQAHQVDSQIAFVYDTKMYFGLLS
jgi:ubiquinone/menaquinone biosynthesis C-methylase UbiE